MRFLITQLKVGIVDSVTEPPSVSKDEPIEYPKAEFPPSDLGYRMRGAIKGKVIAPLSVMI